MIETSKFHLRSFVTTTRNPIESMWTGFSFTEIVVDSLKPEVQTTNRMKSTTRRSFTKFETSALIAMLKDDPKVADEAMRCLYEDREWAAQAIGKVMLKGGNREDAEEVVTDAFLTFQRMVVTGKYRETGNGVGYFLEIVRKSWIDLFRKKMAKKRASSAVNRNEFSWSNLISEHPNIQERLENIEFSRAVRSILDTMSNDCRKILILKESELGHEDMLDEFPNISSGGSLKNKLSKCRNEIKNKIQAYLNLN